MKKSLFGRGGARPPPRHGEPHPGGGDGKDFTTPDLSAAAACDAVEALRRAVEEEQRGGSISVADVRAAVQGLHSAIHDEGGGLCNAANVLVPACAQVVLLRAGLAEVLADALWVSVGGRSGSSGAGAAGAAGDDGDADADADDDDEVANARRAAAASAAGGGGGGNVNVPVFKELLEAVATVVGNHPGVACALWQAGALAAVLAGLRTEDEDLPYPKIEEVCGDFGNFNNDALREIETGLNRKGKLRERLPSLRDKVDRLRPRRHDNAAMREIVQNCLDADDEDSRTRTGDKLQFEAWGDDGERHTSTLLDEGAGEALATLMEKWPQGSEGRAKLHFTVTWMVQQSPSARRRLFAAGLLPVLLRLGTSEATHNLSRAFVPDYNLLEELGRVPDADDLLSKCPGGSVISRLRANCSRPLVKAASKR